MATVFKKKWFLQYYFLNFTRFSNNYLICVFILIFIFVVKINFLTGMRSQNDMLKQKMEILISRGEKNFSNSEVSFQGAASHLSSFAESSIICSHLQSLSERSGLILLDEAVNPLSDIADGKIGRIEISVHFKGSYVPLKETIAKVLALHTGLTLVLFSSRRMRSIDNLLDSDVRFIFFYRKLT